MRMGNEEHYLSVQNLIFAKAHSFARTTGHDTEELIAQGNLIYCQALVRHDPSKAKFITLLYIQLNHGLTRYTKKLSKQIPTSEPIEEISIATKPTCEREHAIGNKLCLLSKEAKRVIAEVLQNPTELFNGEPLKPRQMNKAIKTYLKDKLGCSHNKTYKTMREIKALAYCN